LREAEARHGRPPGLGRLEISVTPSERLGAETVERYAALGVDRLIPYRRAKAEDELHRFIETTAETLIAKA
jgi:hypothetical protein